MTSKMAGCSYGKVTREKVENLSNDFREFRTEMKEEFKDLKETNTKLYNHLSSRLPPWVAILFTIGGSIITGLAVYAITH